MGENKAFSNGRLRGYRHAFGRTQRDLASAIDRNWPTVKGYESGDRRPTPETQLRICDYFGIAPDSLRPRFTDSEADYVDAVASAAGLHLDAATAQAAAAVLAHVGRVRGRSTTTVAASA